MAKLKCLDSKVRLPLHYTEVPNPTPYTRTLPNGRYLIRGEAEKEVKLYVVIDDKWYLVHGNVYSYTQTLRKQWLPALTEKEWKWLEKNYKKLNKEWRTKVYDYLTDKSSRQLSRDFKLYHLRLKRKTLKLN